MALKIQYNYSPNFNLIKRKPKQIKFLITAIISFILFLELLFIQMDMQEANNLVDFNFRAISVRSWDHHDLVY